MKPSSHMLAADIGGTFSRFALFRLDMDEAGLNLVLEEESRIVLPTQGADSFTGLLRKLCASKGIMSGGVGPRCVSVAVPGPVDQGRCLAPNIAWPLLREDLERVLHAPAVMLNDFAAQGLACLFPDILGLRPVLPGSPRAGRSTAVLGAGTGLGKAQILPPWNEADPVHGATSQTPAGAATWLQSDPSCLRAPGAVERHQQGRLVVDDARPARIKNMSRRVLPSEGGHALFPFQGEEEAAFEAFARQISGRRDVIGDMIVTGYGLSLVHAFHRRASTLETPEKITPRLAEYPLVLEWFARFYARACRNFALETLSLGGIYLSGGMIAHVPGLTEHPAFALEFRRSETQKHLLEDLPVYRISNPDAGLWGAVIHGLQLL